MESNFDNLSEEHKSLQTQFKQEKEKENLKCNKCENDSENVPNLKKNRSEYRATSFQMWPVYKRVQWGMENESSHKETQEVPVWTVWKNLWVSRYKEEVCSYLPWK